MPPRKNSVGTRRPPAWLALAGLLLFASPARAQITQTPETVKPGHFLVEMDALSVATNLHDSAGGSYSAVAVATTFLTTGLTNDIDVQVGADVFLSQKYESKAGFTDRNSGFGDLYVRTKWTFWRDERSAVAVMPFVRLPTSTGNVGKRGLQGGVIVPWATYLPGGGEFLAQGELDFLRNDADNGYDSFWAAAAAFQQPLTGLLKLYGEVTVGKSSGGAPWAGTLGGGVQVHLSSLYWWDFAIYRGLSRGAPGWNPVVRLHWGF
ncbi:MAG: transporter [Lacunisphaera sp.]|nr:transporter [Lacunisphaera sp.]